MSWEGVNVLICARVYSWQFFPMKNLKVPEANSKTLTLREF